MSEIAIPRAEREALNAVTVDDLELEIERSIASRQPSALRRLGLEACGPLVSGKVRGFEQAMLRYSQARSDRKQSETLTVVKKASSDLVNAVWQMKERVTKEELAEERFWIDDMITPPYHLSPSLHVTIHYQWRAGPGEDWLSGRIRFEYEAKQPVALLTVKKRTGSGQQPADQDWLYGQWDHLRRLALQEISDYFTAGGDGGSIPEIVQVSLGTHGLNNFSARFRTSV